jgi:hypothetical protein
MSEFIKAFRIVQDHTSLIIQHGGAAQILLPLRRRRAFYIA